MTLTKTTWNSIIYLLFDGHLTIQPAFHYIIHPGADKGLDNVFAGFITRS